MQGVHRSGSKKRDSAASARYDYFETKATIDGKPYFVAFDVEIYPDTNNYRTHKALNEISLTAISGASTGPVPSAADIAVKLTGRCSFAQNKYTTKRKRNKYRKANAV